MLPSTVGPAEVDALLVDLDDDPVGDACQHVAPSDRAGEGVPVGRGGQRRPHRGPGGFDSRIDGTADNRTGNGVMRPAAIAPAEAVPTEVGHPRQVGIFEPRMTFERPAESHSRRLGRDAGEVECVRRADPRRARPVRVDDAGGWMFVRGWDRWSVRAPSSSR